MTDLEVNDLRINGPLYKRFAGSTLPKSSPLEFKKSALTGNKIVAVVFEFQ